MSALRVVDAGARDSFGTGRRDAADVTDPADRARFGAGPGDAADAADATGRAKGAGPHAARWPRPASTDHLDGLVDAAREGDHDAFEQLVRLTSPACYALAYRLVGNEHDARDVVQEAYLRAYRSMRRFRGDSTYSTWLHRITVNCAADLLARRRRTCAELLDDVRDSGVAVEHRAERNPETAADATEVRERLVEALRELPDELRLVVVLRDVYDLPHKEIAKELGISQGAAKVRLHRARLRLRERLFPAWQVPARREDARAAVGAEAAGRGGTVSST